MEARDYQESPAESVKQSGLSLLLKTSWRNATKRIWLTGDIRGQWGWLGYKKEGKVSLHAILAKGLWLPLDKARERSGSSVRVLRTYNWSSSCSALDSTNSSRNHWLKILVFIQEWVEAKRRGMLTKHNNTEGLWLVLWVNRLILCLWGQHPIWTLILLVSTAPLLKHFLLVDWEAVENDRNPWAPEPTWETRRQLLDPGFRLGQF